MNDLSASVEGYTPSYVQRAIKSEVEPAVRELDLAITALPPGQPTGKEDDRVRAAHANKEKAARRVAKILGDLRNFLSAIDAEIDRCLERTRQIDGGVSGVQDDIVRHKFNEARTLAEKERKDAQEQRRLAEKAIADMERILGFSEKFRYPGMDVQRVPTCTKDEGGKEERDPEKASVESDRMLSAAKGLVSMGERRPGKKVEGRVDGQDHRDPG